MLEGFLLLLLFFICFLSKMVSWMIDKAKKVPLVPTCEEGTERGQERGKGAVRV